ncbi:Uncharacterised protein [uncultured Blautia sp.]|nr:Uncharacterised protein [uncultured Blautia sp.]
MTKDYMQPFNPPGRSYLTGILKGCRQKQIPTEPILKAAKRREVFETGDDYLKGICDKVLTLISCSYEWSGARNIVLALPCPFPGHFGAKSVRKYPKSAECETNFQEPKTGI